jgi:hypothetical protein
LRVLFSSQITISKGLAETAHFQTLIPGPSPSWRREPNTLWKSLALRVGETTVWRGKFEKEGSWVT